MCVLANAKSSPKMIIRLTVWHSTKQNGTKQTRTSCQQLKRAHCQKPCVCVCAWVHDTNHGPNQNARRKRGRPKKKNVRWNHTNSPLFFFIFEPKWNSHALTDSRSLYLSLSLSARCPLILPVFRSVTDGQPPFVTILSRNPDFASYKPCHVVRRIAHVRPTKTDTRVSCSKEQNKKTPIKKFTTICNHFFFFSFSFRNWK